MAMEVGNPRRSTPGSGGKGEGLDSASRRVSQSLSFPICKVRDRDSNHLTELLRELNCHLVQCLRGHREDDGDGGNARWLGLTRLFRTRAPISGGFRLEWEPVCSPPALSKCESGATHGSILWGVLTMQIPRPSS